MFNEKLIKLSAEQDFEKAFATLAYTELEQKSPGLFPYLIGFQLINKNEDDSHAVGVFGFKVGEQWYYCPVFWLNGRIKGYDLLYIVSQDIFVPLQESWINYLTNRQPYIMGDETKKTPGELGVVAPDFTIFRRSPITKASSDNSTFANSFRAALPKMLTKISHSPNLLETLEELPAECTRDLLVSMKNEKFAAAMYTFYDPKDIKTLVNRVSGKELWKQSATNDEKHMVSADKGQKVTVLHGSVGADDEVDSFTTMTEKEKEKAMAGAPVIRDKREDREISEVYKYTEFAKTFQNPTEPGLWRVFMSDGTFDTALVSTKPISIGKSIVPPATLVVSLDDKKYTTVNSNGVYAKSQLDMSKWPEFYDSLTSVRNLKEGDVGMLVDKNKNITFPFRVKTVTKGDGGMIDYTVDVDDKIIYLRSQDSKEPYAVSDYDRQKNVEYGFDTYDLGQHIQVAKGKAKMTNIRQNMLVGDEDTKFLKLASRVIEPSPDKSDPWYDWKRENRLTLGSDADIDLHLRRLGMHKMSVHYDGGSELSYTYHGRKSSRQSPNQIVCDMVTKVGMREKTAQTLIKLARVNKGINVLVKEAQAPVFNRPTTAYDDTYRTTVQTPMSEEQMVPTNFASREPAPVDSATFHQAVNAAASGQKDVFDISVLKGLVKRTHIDENLRDFIKDMIVGNDRIGRILFLYYWHFDEFADKYGDEDMIELEDLLKETFKSTGDLILFLKQKSVELDDIATEAVVDI